MSENSDVVSMEPISPELALVDPELGARARASLEDPRPAARRTRRGPSARRAARREHRPYPFWARVTAALWLLVLGILIGGAAIPHAQDTPRVVPQAEDERFCRVRPRRRPSRPSRALSGGRARPALGGSSRDDVASRGYNRASPGL